MLARCLCALTFFIAAYSARRTNCKACSAKSVWQRVPGAGLPRARRVRHSSKPARPGTAGTSRAGAGAGGAGARSCGHIGKRCRGAGQQAAAPAAPMLLGARHFARGQYCRARVTSREANATLQPRASGRGSLSSQQGAGAYAKACSLRPPALGAGRQDGAHPYQRLAGAGPCQRGRRRRLPAENSVAPAPCRAALTWSLTRRAPARARR